MSSVVPTACTSTAAVVGGFPANDGGVATAKKVGTAPASDVGTSASADTTVLDSGVITITTATTDPCIPSGTTTPIPTPTDSVDHSTTVGSTDTAIGVPTVGLPVAESAAITGATNNPASTATAGETKVFLPEGATVRVLKPELEVRFLPVNSIPDETVSVPFKLTDNVSAIKGLAVERLKERFAMNVEMERIIVARDGDGLKDGQPLVELVFPYGILTVAYPEDGISTRERKVSVELDLEPDFFSLFDSE